MTTLVRGHGLGNDYLVLESGEPLTPERVVALCDRHTGIGSDGILEPFSTARADHGVRIWNPDGSIAEKSGNGLRIFARWLVDHAGASDRFTVWTGACLVACEVLTDAVRVEMGHATVDALTVQVDGNEVRGQRVDVGNPHFVVFVDDFDLDWRALGAALECHPAFPNRTNVQFVHVTDRIDARIWERGAGETKASGSSSCAVAAASVATGRWPPGRLTIHMEGGVLTVDVAEPHPYALVLTGPVELVARIEVFPGQPR